MGSTFLPHVKVNKAFIEAENQSIDKHVTKISVEYYYGIIIYGAKE